MQIPPADIRVNGDHTFATRQVAKYNTLLEVTYKDQIITTELIENQPHAIIEDGVHLSEESSEVMAKQLQQTIENRTEPATIRSIENTIVNPQSTERTVDDSTGQVQVTINQPAPIRTPSLPQPAYTTREVTTSHAHAAVIIGRAGTRIKNIKA